jgi:hypothetical protein
MFSSECISFRYPYRDGYWVSIFDVPIVFFYPTKDHNCCLYIVTCQLLFCEGIYAAGERSVLDVLRNPTVDMYNPALFYASWISYGLGTIELHYILLSKRWTKICYLCLVISFWWNKVRLCLTVIWTSAANGWKLRSKCCWFRYTLDWTVQSSVWGMYQILENHL